MTLYIGRRSYSLVCEDGQEEHIRNLGAEIDARLRRLGGNLSLNDAKNLLMAALMLADEWQEERQRNGLSGKGAGQASPSQLLARVAALEEQLSDAEDEQERLRQHLIHANAQLHARNGSGSDGRVADDQLAERLEALADMLENSASRLEEIATTH